METELKDVGKQVGIHAQFVVNDAVKDSMSWNYFDEIIKVFGLGLGSWSGQSIKIQWIKLLYSFLI